MAEMTLSKKRLLGQLTKIGVDKRRIFLAFSFHKGLLTEVKKMKGARWEQFSGLKEYVQDHFKTDKVWSVDNCERNLWALAYLRGEDPYAHYKSPIGPVYSGDFPVLPHQRTQTDFVLNRRRCLLACGLGLGKTLAVISAWEAVKPTRLVYFCPKGTRPGLQHEFSIWNPKIIPELYTCSEAGINKAIDNGPPPQFVVFDECHDLKSITSKRNKAARRLAKLVRETHGENAFVVGMTGTVAPQDPTDWYGVLEVIQPGYIAEGDVRKFERRLAVYEEVDYGFGPVQEVRTWKDREGLPWCHLCSKTEEQHPVAKGISPWKDCKHFVQCKNEVKALYNRLSDKIVLFQHTEDHLQLPPLEHKIVDCKIDEDILDRAKAVAAMGGNDILGKMRQLSDGFLYKHAATGLTQTCSSCNGTGIGVALLPKIDDLPPLAEGQSEEEYMQLYFEEGELPCDRCEDGQEPLYSITVEDFGSPKRDALRKILAEHDNRICIYAGFTGSIDVCKDILAEEGWQWICCEGKRGWQSSAYGQHELVQVFQDRDQYPEKIGFVGHPGAAGAGLTLHASPTIVYYSNDFNTKNRIQSEGRSRRLGTPHDKHYIVDLFHLPTDKYVYDKIQIKRARMDLSQGLDVDMNEILRLLGVEK